MQPPGSASARIGLFALLALSSLALKAAAGPPRDGLVGARAGEFERIASSRLQAQHFAIKTKTSLGFSTLLLAERGNCRLAVRDARRGSAFAPLFAQEARSIGRVTYLYRGRQYSAPPELTLRLRRIEAEVLHRLGLDSPIPVLVAFAASPSCGSTDFGMGAIRVET
jgi:hypothetical protein